jgi:hypothetical protein
MSNAKSLLILYILSICSVKEAKRFLEKHSKKLDVAIDAYYNDPAAMAAAARRHESSGPSTSKLSALFDKYKGPCSLIELLRIMIYSILYRFRWS